MFLLKKYINRIFITCIFSLISLNSYSFRLQNVYFNQRMDTPDGGYREFYIENDYLSKQRYKVNILPGDKNDASKFIEVYPKVITVDPKSKGTVKIFAKAPRDSKKGEYNFKLQFQPINIPTLAKNKDGITAGTSNINIAPIIELTGYVGEINFNEALRLSGIKVEKNDSKGIIVSGILSNDSYTSIDFGVEAYGSNNFLYGSSYGGNVLRNTKNKKMKFLFPTIKEPKDLKKIVFYRTPSNIREVIKEIKLEK